MKKIKNLVIEKNVEQERKNQKLIYKSTEEENGNG